MFAGASNELRYEVLHSPTTLWAGFAPSKRTAYWPASRTKATCRDANGFWVKYRSKSSGVFAVKDLENRVVSMSVEKWLGSLMGLKNT